MPTHTHSPSYALIWEYYNICTIRMLSKCNLCLHLQYLRYMYKNVLFSLSIYITASLITLVQRMHRTSAAPSPLSDHNDPRR